MTTPDLENPVVPQPISWPRLAKAFARLLGWAVGCSLLSLGITEGVLRLCGLPTGATRTVRMAYDLEDATLGPFIAGADAFIRWPPAFPYRAHFNSLGCRGAEPRESDQPPILCVGDSYTYGFGVEDDETWPALLDVLLAEAGRPRAVVNLSSGHLTIDDQLHYLPRALRELKPSQVILLAPGHGYNDATSNLVVTPHQRSKRRERKRRAGNPLMTGYRHTALYEAHWFSKRYRERMSSIGNGLLPIQPKFSDAERAALNERYERNLTAMRTMVEASGAEFLVSAFPSVEVKGEEVLFLEPWTAKLSRRLGIRCVDVTPAFAAAKDPQTLLQLPYDVHARPKGNALVAEGVFAELVRGGKER